MDPILPEASDSDARPFDRLSDRVWREENGGAPVVALCSLRNRHRIR